MSFPEESVSPNAARLCSHHDAISDCNTVIARMPNYLYALCSRAEA
jgi:hypothetical protein